MPYEPLIKVNGTNDNESRQKTFMEFDSDALFAVMTLPTFDSFDKPGVGS
jgi:hypothetical protein